MLWSGLVEFLTNASANGNNDMQIYLLELARFKTRHINLSFLSSSINEACERADESTVILLLQYRVPVNYCPYGLTPLQKAIVRGHLAITTLLLHFGTDVNLGLSPRPLAQALMLEHDAIARLFVDKGAFLDVADRDWLYEMDLDRKAPFDITEDKLDRWTDRICGFQWAWFEGEEV